MSRIHQYNHPKETDDNSQNLLEEWFSVFQNDAPTIITKSGIVEFDNSCYTAADFGSPQ